MQTPSPLLPTASPSPSTPVPSPAARPGTLHAGSRGIWKDTRTKPLAA